MSSETAHRSESLREFLPYSLDYIPDFLQERAKSELFENEDTRTNSLKLFRAMLKDEPDLRWQDEDLFLMSFLRARKFDVKRAFELIKTFYTVMGKHDELYYNVQIADVKRVLQENIFGFLPYRDHEGCVVMLLRVSHWNPQLNSMGDLVRCLTFSLLHASLSPATQIAGFKVIFDFSGLTMRYLPHVSPTYLWLLAEALQSCYPGRFKAIHLVNENHIFSYIWAIFKQFITKKLRDRIHFHGKNVKNLLKYFSPSILPADYGGELPSYDNTEWGKAMIDKFSYYEHVLSYSYQKHKLKAQAKYSSSN